jgi:hypothetical protein
MPGLRPYGRGADPSMLQDQPRQQAGQRPPRLLRHDELFKWCKDRKEKLVVEIDASVQAEVARIMAAYPRLVDTVKGRSGSDPFVIALAATTKPPMVVVTEEYAGKVRIPDVCAAEKIEYCRLADLIEREDWKFR